MDIISFWCPALIKSLKFVFLSEISFLTEKKMFLKSLLDKYAWLLGVISVKELILGLTYNTQRPHVKKFV